MLLLAASMHASEKHDGVQDHLDHKVFKMAVNQMGAMIHVARPTFQALMDSNIISKEHGQELIMATELIDRVYQNIHKGGSPLSQAIPSEPDHAGLSSKRNPVGQSENVAEDIFINHGACDGK